MVCMDAKYEKYADCNKNNILSLSIADMDLSVRAYNCLHRAGYETLGDLLNIPDAKNIYRIHNLGIKTAKEVAQKIRDLGFQGTAWDEVLVLRNNSTND